MYKWLTLLVVFTLVGCATPTVSTNKSEWDFDHEVRFEQKKLAENKYHLVVISNDKTHFSRLATFLVRKSMNLCNQYGFKIEILSGVEGVDDRRGLPNMIMPSLAANVECPPK